MASPMAVCKMLRGMSHSAAAEHERQPIFVQSSRCLAAHACHLSGHVQCHARIRVSHSATTESEQSIDAQGSRCTHVPPHGLRLTACAALIGLVVAPLLSMSDSRFMSSRAVASLHAPTTPDGNVQVMRQSAWAIALLGSMRYSR
jgi:hypothetical protein